MVLYRLREGKGRNGRGKREGNVWIIRYPKAKLGIKLLGGQKEQF